jgi:3-phosphoshikimate 1-carboxyvinyltransferase
MILHCVEMAGRSIAPALHPLDAVLVAPPSKSVTHRAFVAAALARGSSRIVGPLVADDTEVTLGGLVALGIAVEREPESVVIHGGRDHLAGGASVALRESGTSMRLLLAVAALGRAPSCLDGSARLRERPLAELAQALVSLGAEVELTGRSGGLPATAGGKVPSGGRVVVRGGTTSQYASALLLVAPALPCGLELTLEPPLVSLPYVELTVRVLEAFGAHVGRPGPGSWIVEPGATTGRELRVEGDHSTAAYFLAAAAIAGGRVRVSGLDPASPQPDARIARILGHAGATVTIGPDWVQVEGRRAPAPIREDLTDAPDLAPTLAAVSLMAEGPSELRGLGHLRHKESDRLSVVARNLERLGCGVEAGETYLRITPPPRSSRGVRVEIEAASDHRIAMAFAIAGLATDGVTIDDPDCVSKSNPEFWSQLDRLRG